ncbi:hypothetical protein DGG96_01035 [Legionella qingyii]|uniref:Ankyrin repeat domain-containing protein n=1 Tax=Legionella qingyii TaxID=2184757 RepID=A0A317U812_9GAMM|nr:hypothetical protein [Legionella qingyii]PWY57046.1 hypothetical protein DGG96_03390 [Legionella qingyii]PWY57333.1 hypothetical protein DGG96_01035 [Legionella qingyii]RUR26422.1 hypothetical protein ELY20_00440 [Legionella qingyii]RUR27442.1 hypothetical protein ELY16_04785 [Legionella qingyii]
MTPQEEALWQAITKKEYEKVKTLITDYPELVNAVNTNGRTLLMRVVLLLTPPLDLIEFIAKQPDLSFESAKATKTTMSVILSTGRPEILELFANDPRIIFDGENLAYATAKKYVGSVASEKIEKYTKMLTIVRDATIRQAIMTDDPSLLERLEKEGDNLAQPLSDGKFPARLITKECPAPNVKLWFQSQVGKNGASIANHVDSFFSHTYKMQEIEKEMEEVNRRMLESNIKLFDKTYDSTMTQMEHVVSSLSLTN